jgi:hypothetical protein
MWNEILKQLPHYQSSVLTTVDASGYPASARVGVTADSARRVLVVAVPAGAEVMTGGASLVFHAHDELLWNLRSMQVRGTLVQKEQGWLFTPEHLVPGMGFTSVRGMWRFVTRARRTAAGYLAKRNLPRPRIPWQEIEACKK